MPRSERSHRVLVAVLISLALFTGLIGMFAVWANRQALNTDNWTQTSGRLLENKQVQTAVSAYLVDQLFTNVDVAGEIQKALPSQLSALATPAAAGLQEAAGRVAPQILANPRVHAAWRSANRLAHEQLIAILNGGGKVLTTSGGAVTLNLHPLVDELASRLGISPSAVAAARAKVQGAAGAAGRAAAQQRLGLTLPPASGQIVIMRANNLKAAQDIAKAIRHLAVIFTVLTLLLFAAAIALASNWRRVALRTTGWCFTGLGLLVLLGRRVGGDAVVNGLVPDSSVRPAAHAAWTIGTTLLNDIAFAMIFYGVVIVIAAWIAGATRPAYALRRALAGPLRNHLASFYGAVGLLFLLYVAWGPTNASRKPIGIIVFAAAIVLGVELLRRQVAREFPDTAAGDTGKRVRAWVAGVRDGRGRATAEAPRDTLEESTAVTSRFQSLEQLAALHDRGVLSDDEFASQKVLILNGS